MSIIAFVDQCEIEGLGMNALGPSLKFFIRIVVCKLPIFEVFLLKFLLFLKVVSLMTKAIAINCSTENVSFLRVGFRLLNHSDLIVITKRSIDLSELEYFIIIALKMTKYSSFKKKAMVWTDSEIKKLIS